MCLEQVLIRFHLANNSIFEYKKICIRNIGGIKILESLMWRVVSQRLGNTDPDCSSTSFGQITCLLFFMHGHS